MGCHSTVLFLNSRTVGLICQRTVMKLEWCLDLLIGLLGNEVIDLYVVVCDEKAVDVF